MIAYKPTIHTNQRTKIITITGHHAMTNTYICYRLRFFNNINNMSIYIVLNSYIGTVMNTIFKLLGLHL